MKNLLTLFILTISLTAGATNWLTYYVYFETEYIQGPWTRTDLLEESEYKYLAPEVFEDNFGSIDSDIVNKMLSHLKERKPDLYNWSYDLTFQGDTVVLSSKEKIENFETIKNEITATLTLNNFKAVTFKFPDKSETLIIDDLTLPYFDLVTNTPRESQAEETPEIVKKTAIGDKPHKDGNPLTIWLIISAIINSVLIGILIFRSKEKQDDR